MRVGSKKRDTAVWFRMRYAFTVPAGLLQVRVCRAAGCARFSGRNSARCRAETLPVRSRRDAGRITLLRSRGCTSLRFIWHICGADSLALSTVCRILHLPPYVSVTDSLDQLQSVGFQLLPSSNLTFGWYDEFSNSRGRWVKIDL
ncbi:hypothetical protein NPIL_187961 [Nephila pilipes]|uniref:F5/8 type C domain-containing protein n=1 Tax=Nephila pilipes TaxID=299642 RepID=A0A8X6QI76_NEPPI|nr:hypothetical protein NPIL_187961 [Nephila pilipes]